MVDLTVQTLSDLFGERVPAELAGLEVSGFCVDSRAVGAGDVFVALQGERSNGAAYAAKALASGAIAVLADTNNAAFEAMADIPLIQVDDLDARLPEIAAEVYGNPAQRLHVVGITGTNGKTSCAWLYAHWVALLQAPCGLIGTLGCGVVGRDGAELASTGFTTPDAFALHRCLAEIDAAACGRVAMEVSSHALAQGRVAGIGFATAIFTNLSRDHLDYHGDMASYASAKRQLFLTPGLQHAVISIDSTAGRELLKSLPADLATISYSLTDESADVYVRELISDINGSRAVVHTQYGVGELHCPMPGEFNVANMLAVLAALLAEGYALADLLSTASSLPSAPGRMQRVVVESQTRNALDFAVFIDFAHTPDALEKALLALRPHVQGLLRVVFGAGGDRDKGKRAVMGKTASQFADSLVITSDNPRSESPAAIAEDIAAGVAANSSMVIELDRARAIKQAIDAANAGDVVLIAGKGHESYQEQGGEKRPFNDYAIAEAALLARCAA